MSGRRIDTVVRIRRLQERLARGEVAARQGVLAERSEGERYAWRLVGDRSRLVPAIGGRLVAHHEMLRTGVDEARNAGIEVLEARAEVGKAIAEWQERAQRLDGIERLADRIATNERAERARVESNELDDFVVGRWGGAHDRPGVRDGVPS